MRIGPPVIVAAALLALTAAPALAGEPSRTCDEWPWSLYVPPGSRDGESYPVYVVRDTGFPSHVDSFWVYHEANGIPGLQRYDDWCYDPGYEWYDNVITGLVWIG